MKLSDRLQAVTRLFLDSAPVVYFVEKNPRYFDAVRVAFNRIDEASLIAVTSLRPEAALSFACAPPRRGYDRAQPISL